MRRCPVTKKQNSDPVPASEEILVRIEQDAHRVICYTLFTIPDCKIVFRELANGTHQPLFFETREKAFEYADALGKREWVDVCGLDAEGRQVLTDAAPTILTEPL